jgi:hypothetical protein
MLTIACLIFLPEGLDSTDRTEEVRVRSASLEEALGRVWHASQRDGDVRISLEEALAHVWQVHVILSSHPSLVPNTDVSDDRPRMICFYASTP